MEKTTPPPSNSPCVLLVDDDVDSLYIFGRFLERAGYALLVTTNGPAAIRLARERRPSFVVLDLVMAPVDGERVLQALRESEETRDVPVLAVTGYPERFNRKDILKQGFVDYLVKPIPHARLVDAIATHMRSPRA